MASRNDQAVPVTNAENKNIFAIRVALWASQPEARQELSLSCLPPLHQFYRRSKSNEARAHDHPGLAKGAKGGKPEEIL
ncbi:hypothetical protein ACFX12_007347 [Malus domestica]